MARIIAVADTLDAMTTNRPYQSAMELEDALRHHPQGCRHEIRSEGRGSARS